METEIINYTYKGNVYPITLEAEGENGNSLVPVENESFNFINGIIDGNENAVLHLIDENNIVLLENEKELEVYENKINKQLKGQLNPDVSKTDWYENLKIYSNYWYDISSILVWNNGILNSPSICFFRNGTNEDRLRYMHNTTYWTFSVNAPTFCRVGSTPYNSPQSHAGDKVSSFQVRNCKARFYEHHDYKGRSLLVDARTGPRTFSRLYKVKMTWRKS